MSIRQQILSDIATGNLTERYSVGPVERHIAIAKSGSDLSRAIDRLHAEARAKDYSNEDGRDFKDFRPATARVVAVALMEVAERSFRNEVASIELDDRRKLCLIAIMERTVQRCEVCQGRREVRIEGHTPIICAGCKGTGRRQSTNKSRDRAFGRGLEPKHVTALECVLATWDHNEHSTNSAVADMYLGDI